MDMNTDTNARPKYVHNGKVMLGSAILLFLILLIIIFLHACPHSCFRRRRSQRRHNSHLFRPISTTTATAQSHTKGLDPSLFKFLPTFTYSSANPQECAVCLAEFEEDDEGRVLPHCNHGFHSHCIDTWFQSHSNCPICRAPVQPIKISPQRTPVSNSEGEIAGCSNLPPPIGCPRKGLEVVSVVVDEMWSRSSERVEKFG